MKKRCFAGLLALFLWVIPMGALLPALPTQAAGSLPRLVDDADLLTDAEEAQLLGRLDEISERQQLDVVVVTADSIGGESAESFADDFFDDYGYGMGADRDGVLLLICVAERNWHVSTSGYGITAFTDAGIDYMAGQFVDYLSNDDYAMAFSIYADLCDEFITQARAGAPYDVGSFSKTPFGIMHITIAFGAAFVIALIVTGIMRKKLKSVRGRKEAGGYITVGSMQLTRESDMFLYSHVTRSVKPKNHGSGGSSTHRSSSGRRHGGRGGRF